jgi:hypothetical protein
LHRASHKEAISGCADNAFTPVNIDPNLVNGWGLASFFVRQIEGELAKTPSWWLGVAS